MHRPHPRHLSLAVALATLLVPLVVGSVSAHNRPAVTITPTVTDASVSVRVDFNRAPRRIAGCTYVLDSHAPAKCGPADANGKKASRYTIALTNQAAGGHTMTVTVRLTGNRRLSGSADFTIAAPSRVFAIAYSNLDGQQGFDLSSDALIARLVDSNGDGVISAGDTIEVDSFPADVTGVPRIGVTIATHTVASVYLVNPTAVVVFDAAGDDFDWITNAQSYEENAAGNGTDDLSKISRSICLDQVELDSPSRPTAAANTPFTTSCPNLVTVELSS